jgi:hypothetical protein
MLSCDKTILLRLWCRGPERLDRLYRRGKKEVDTSFWSAKKVVLLGIRSEDYHYRVAYSLRGVKLLAHPTVCHEVSAVLVNIWNTSCSCAVQGTPTRHTTLSSQPCSVPLSLSYHTNVVRMTRVVRYLPVPLVRRDLQAVCRTAVCGQVHLRMSPAVVGTYL